MTCLCRHGSEAEVQLQTIRNLGAGIGWCGQHHAPANLTPGNTWSTLYRRLDGPQVKFGRVRKTSPPSVFDPRTVQLVASWYTDWAIPAANNNNNSNNNYYYYNTEGHPTWLLPFLIVVPPCILITTNYFFQRMHSLLKHKILQFVFKCFT
jgi:hypothetical protein